jgi:hypothetical protein
LYLRFSHIRYIKAVKTGFAVKISVASSIIAAISFFALLARISKDRDLALSLARQDLERAKKYVADIKAKSEAEASKMNAQLKIQGKHNASNEWKGYKIESSATEPALSNSGQAVVRRTYPPTRLNSYTSIPARTPIPSQLSTPVWSTASNYCLYRAGGMSTQSAWNKAVLEAEKLWRKELKFSRQINNLYGVLVREEIAEQCP